MLTFLGAFFAKATKGTEASAILALGPAMMVNVTHMPLRKNDIDMCLVLGSCSICRGRDIIVDWWKFGVQSLWEIWEGWGVGGRVFLPWLPWDSPGPYRFDRLTKDQHCFMLCWLF